MRVLRFAPMRTTEFWPAGSGPEDAPWTDREIELPGRGCVSVREAQGPAGAPALVLLHGLAATGRLNWFTAIPALAEHFRVVVLDHRGHGRGIPTRHFRLADCADDAVALAENLDIEQFVAVGYSMGGPIAKLCWNRHPERVTGLVLCATANHFMRPEARGAVSAVFPGVVLAARGMPKVFRKRIVAGMLRGMRPGERLERARRELMQSDAAAVMQAARAVIRFSSHDWASNITIPSAVIVMTEDRLVPPKRQYRLARSIPGSRMFEIEADHLACVQSADLFVPTLLEACKHVSDRAAA